MTSKFKMSWFLKERRYWAGKLYNMNEFRTSKPDKDKTFSGSLVLNLIGSRAHTLYLDLPYGCQYRSSFVKVNKNIVVSDFAIESLAV